MARASHLDLGMLQKMRTHMSDVQRGILNFMRAFWLFRAIIRPYQAGGAYSAYFSHSLCGSLYAHTLGGLASEPLASEPLASGPLDLHVS